VPTVLDLAGGAGFSPQWRGETAPPLPGTSLAPAFRKDGAVRHEFIYFHHIDNRAICVGDWKAVAKGKNGPWELYDLRTDRCEAKDLAGKYPDKVRQMSALWQECEDRFRAQAGPPPEKKPRQRRK
jgi:arylsulfatase